LLVSCDAPTQISTGESNPVSIAVDANNVYWTDEYGGGPRGFAVVKAPLAGGSPTVLAVGQAPSGLVVDDTYVYWTDQLAGTVTKTPISGGTSITLASGDVAGQPLQPSGIAQDAGNLYFESPYGPTQGLILSVPKTGGSPTIIASGQPYPNWGIAVDATSVYWVNNGTNPLYADSAVMKAPLMGGGAPIALATYPFVYAPNGLALDGENVYWTNSNGTVMKVPKDGGCPELLANAFIPWGIAVDQTHVYWTNEGYDGTGTVMKVPIGGGCAAGLAAGGNLLGIALTAGDVYWVDQGIDCIGCGSVSKHAKQ
jgi:hypothetical protein